MNPEEISGQVVDAAYQIHSRLGPGLLESVYEALMIHELVKRGLRVERQVPVPLSYDGVVIDLAFRADLLVADTLIVELKSVDALTTIHRKQLLTYLKVSGKPVGLLINFNASLIRDGIVRLVNQLPAK